MNERRLHPRSRVAPGAVVLPAPSRIDEGLVRLGNALKHLLGGPVARIDTRDGTAVRAGDTPV